MFQFHNGSIKSQSIEELASMDNEFQFHNGSIKSVIAFSGIMKSATFQFHNGSIKSRSRETDSQELSPVSIPQWFD